MRPWPLRVSYSAGCVGPSPRARSSWPGPPIRLCGSLAAVYVFELQQKPNSPFCGSVHNPQLPSLLPHDTSVAGLARSASPIPGHRFVNRPIHVDRRCAVLLNKIPVVVRHSLSSNLPPPERLMDSFNASRQMKSRSWERGKSSIHRVKVVFFCVQWGFSHASSLYLLEPAALTNLTHCRF